MRPSPLPEEENFYARAAKRKLTWGTFVSGAGGLSVLCVCRINGGSRILCFAVAANQERLSNARTATGWFIERAYAKGVISGLATSVFRSNTGTGHQSVKNAMKSPMRFLPRTLDPRPLYQITEDLRGS